jgi:hypothetical protein
MANRHRVPALPRVVPKTPGRDNASHPPLSISPDQGTAFAALPPAQNVALRSDKVCTHRPAASGNRRVHDACGVTQSARNEVERGNRVMANE